MAEAYCMAPLRGTRRRPKRSRKACARSDNGRLFGGLDTTYKGCGATHGITVPATSQSPQWAVANTNPRPEANTACACGDTSIDT